MEFSLQPHIKDEHLPLAPKMKGSDGISSDSSDSPNSQNPRDYNVTQESNNTNVLFASYYRKDRFKALEGLPNLKCMFCESYSPIKFDMDLHLYKDHRENLLTDLPIQKKKGFRMSDRIDYAINRMESEAHKSKRYFA